MAEKIIIDATETVLGRLCSYVAKQALGGSELVVVNAEKAIISGNKTDVINKYKKLRAMGGTANHGPNYPRSPEMILRRTIRGMLPNYREGHARDSFLRVKCYNGVPAELAKEKKIKMNTNLPRKYIDLKELSEKL